MKPTRTRWISADIVTVPSGNGACRNAGPRFRRGGRTRSIAAAVLMSALPSRLGHHAEPLDSRPADPVHRLDDGPVVEPGVGLEIEGLVRPVAEGITQLAFEGGRGKALVVQIQRLVLRQG